MTYRVVWYKRDLRLHDHAPLATAAQAGPVLCLYVVEPDMWAQPDASARQWGFVRESLQDLDRELRARGGRLVVRVGDVVAVLSHLHARAPFVAVHAHEETGNGWTYVRDRAVAAWCRAQGVSLCEWPQYGVVRGLRERDGWQRRRDAFMADPAVVAPLRIDEARQPDCVSALPEAHQLGLTDADAPWRQRGGRRAALAVLDDFLRERSLRYRGGISSPLSAVSACSRLSPYLAHGCLGLREVEQATQARLAQLPTEAQSHRHGLQGFQSRLAWHCHFIQKLESEPELEWRNLHRGYDGLREDEWSDERFAALVQGRTGWPLVDACVAMLRETGWLNFRMRAMLVSVAAYPLWLHWREVGLWLARQFVDYEPGIHWSQLQMQSGTTGINTTRVYNPVKQARDQDPHGRFVRRWLPAMRRVPDAWLFEPWRMPAETQLRCGVRVGVDIPMPLVDLDAALRQAKARMHALRARPEVQAAEAAVVRRHASRAGRREQPARRRSAAELAQQSLF
ncbi:MAG: deoxyribodipyrimidine photo-lyase [Hydrogenophaga sp.]|jgi:deoxyribodipyrimidine photo-lyase|nr:deoxyribodipyrimidine photo-lyase [Hydrogenophaga sp.]